jgi:Na+-translocating ferredoxin:NAD+ oxidoreductase subunit B
MTWLLLALAATLVAAVQFGRRLPDEGPERGAAARSPLWPALRIRSRTAWCESVETYEGYGEARVAVLACAARPEQNRLRFASLKRGSCRDLQLVHGGERACDWACLGEGDCAAACPEDAIRMVDGLPRIDEAACTGCGDCLPACPRRILTLLPADAQLTVACGSGETESLRRGRCDTGCRDSRRCFDTTHLPEGLVFEQEGRRLIDYTRSANLLPLKALCPSSVFRDRIPHRPWFMVTQRCTGCGDCLPACPAPNCILPSGELAPDGRERVRIEARACVGCGLCVPACPEQAIRVVGAVGFDSRLAG